MKKYLDAKMFTDMTEDDRHQLDEVVNELERQSFDRGYIAGTFDPFIDLYEHWCQYCQELCQGACCDNLGEHSTIEVELMTEEVLNELENHSIIPEEELIISNDIKDLINCVIDSLANHVFCSDDVEGYEDAIIFTHLHRVAQHAAESNIISALEVVKYMISKMIDFGFYGLENWNDYYLEIVKHPRWSGLLLRQFDYWNSQIKCTIYNQRHPKHNRR